MKFLFFIFSLNIFFLAVNAQQNKEVVIGNVDSIHSQILHEQRYFWVHLPASARDGQHPKKRYPVVYVLDGDKNFTYTVGMIDLLSSTNGNNFCPEMIVVGILNTDRFRDLTPTHVASGLWVDSATGKRSGGGEAFTNFLEKELMPHIDSNYPAGQYKMLIGHSLGGLMAINILAHHTNIFNSYVAIEPSLWWNDQKLLHETLQIFNANSFRGQALFLAMAHTQIPGMDTIAVQQDNSESTIHPRSILELSHHLASAKKNGLDADYKYYDDETHASSPLISTYDALHFIFADYSLSQNNYFTDPAFPLANFFKNHYALIAAKYKITADDGSPLLPPEAFINNQGYYAMSLKQYDKAADLFKMNIRNYPAGSVAYNYLGDLYNAKGDIVNAIASYQVSLSLQDSDEIRKKLEKLKKK